MLAEPLYALDAVTDAVVFHIWYDGKAHGFHRVKRLSMARVYIVGAVLHIEADYIQFSRRRYLWVELTYRTGRGVTGICKELFAVYLALGVELVKYSAGHIYLAADDQALGGVFYPERERADGTEIFGDVLSDNAVAARRTADEYAVLILKRHRQPVDLRLDRVAVMAGKHAVHALAEGEQLVNGENVRQALERDLMMHRLKL